MSLGMRIKVLRKASGKTQQVLAEEVGVSRIYVQALESNRRLPSMKLLHRLALALQVDPGDLVQNLPQGKGSRFQIEELFSREADVEIWYRSKKLSTKDLRLVGKLIDAALSEWEQEEAQEECN
ncbi:helix-turn-helix transcriptional regulator [Aminithiophilus ramosus]|uniref:Helix-turn-helix transcriptional regulator n=2 Tax=Synergistales TaxID=649776 RepID=A0A9Q7EXT3_9BACT|nr:helix-turn-helix transcriptional regulator [Aminithiophilus ramosus]QTX32800.1 helix-turn-helix transcriptional regulator [Aminithiophilus ramosus]QVL36675.1 helix-turn-helix transcriptional regulator [Synergistota bacterium]